VIERAQLDLGEIEGSLRDAVATSRGHFLYESGHHGDLWLDLDGLFIDAQRTRTWVTALAQRLAICQTDFICGPLTGGAFVAQLLAAEIGAGFAFAERRVLAETVRYTVPTSLRAALSGQRILLVDDAVNAGSALLLTLESVLACGSELIGFASLLTLGDAASRLGERYSVPFFALLSLDRAIWLPEECPLCRAGMPLVDYSAPPQKIARF
jgi:orotate phosphoribosyltransferase